VRLAEVSVTSGKASFSINAAGLYVIYRDFMQTLLTCAARSYRCAIFCTNTF